MKKMLLFLFVFSFSNIFSMNSAIQWGSGFIGIAMMLYGYSTKAENNGYNKELDLFKTQLTNTWTNNQRKEITIGSNEKNKFGISTDDNLLIERRAQLLQLFSHALSAELNIRCSLKNLVDKSSLKYIHNPEGQGSSYTWHKGTKTTNEYKTHFVFVSDKNLTSEEKILEEILKELELVKNQIILPLFDDKKSQIPAYVMGGCGVGLLLFGCFYKKIFSLK